MKNNRKISTAYIDYQIAFDSVPHLSVATKNYKMPTNCDDEVVNCNPSTKRQHRDPNRINPDQKGNLPGQHPKPFMVLLGCEPTLHPPQRDFSRLQHTKQ